MLPWVLADFLPVEVDLAVSWAAVLEGAGVGFGIGLVFALLPLASVRRVSPLEVLRVSVVRAGGWDGFRVATLGVLGVSVLLFALGHTRRWQDGLGFAGGLAVAFGLLALVARGLVAIARRIRLAGWPFVIRQGWASVHRPNNRTLLLMVSLGLGTFLLLTLQWTQSALLRPLAMDDAGNRPNAILFDIQPDQREGVAEVIRERGLRVWDEAAIVTMRLRTIRGRAVEEMLSDRTEERPRWALRREFRSTYAERLRDSERLKAGVWVARVEPGTEPVPISVEEGIARELGVGLGDEIEWDVQGVPVVTRVESLREVDWRRVQPNFFVVFPAGVLEEAPAFHVLVTRVDSAEASAALQRAVVGRYPNVSVVDITLVLGTLDQVLGRIAFVIRFMALFTVVTGLVVLVASVVSGRWQRVRESILLRVLGATRRQALGILLVEYAVLGCLAALTGVVLALGGSAALALLVFDVPFVPALGPALGAVVVVTGLTMASGWLASRGVTNHPPLEILRTEV